MDRRTLIASLLIFLVLLFYPRYVEYINRRLPPAPLQPVPTQTPAAPRPTIPLVELPEEAVTVEETMHVLQLDGTRFELSNVGGGIKATELVRRVATGSQTFPISSSKNHANYLFSISSGDLTLTGREAYRIADASPTQMIMVYERPNDVRVTKQFTLDTLRQTMQVQVAVVTLGSAPRTATLAVVSAGGLVIEQGGDEQFVEAVAKSGSTVHKAKPPSVAKRNGLLLPDPTAWILTRNKYFCQAVRPESPSPLELRAPSSKELVAVFLPTLALAPGEPETLRFEAYVGQDDYNTLKRLGLEEARPLGLLGWIGQVLLGLLHVFYRLGRNYGLAIILLTVTVSVALYPLTLKSLRSMKNLQELQPKVEQLRRQYQENPKKLNTELMELYKKHKVNPLGGCLPMVLQMPFFFALYNVLQRSVELKGASFLWIQDLSKPDAAFQLAVTLPILGNLINVLPLLMIAGMVLQQRLSTMRIQPATPEQAQQQRIMGVLMPLFFGVLFYHLPSGLVLYWLTNTCIMISVQLWTLRS